MSGNEVATVKPMDRFKQELALRESMLKDLLPKGMTVQKFQAIVVAAVADNMDLLDCDRGSLLKSCLQAAELGLSLNKAMGEADILKTFNRGRTEAQFRPRYKGLMKLALQAGDVLKIESRIVYAKDQFEIEEGIESRIIHKHGLGNRGDMIGAYCVWKLRNGESQFEVMDKEEIEAIRNRSEGWKAFSAGKIKSTPWSTDPAEMWRKTVVRRATKYMPLSTEAARAVHIDNVAEGIIDTDIGEVTDADDITAGMFDEDTGEIFDEAPTQAAETQLERIAEKVAAKPKAKAEPQWSPKRIAVPETADGGDDWGAWSSECVEYLSTLGSAKKISVWAEVHSDILNEAELVAPDEVSALLDMI